MASKLSTDELFHFTKLDNLVNIIKTGFYPRFNLEHTLLSNYFNRPAAVTPVPMVSFCDIPLNLVDEHISKYGTCAIGLTKEWGYRYGLNPVIYINPNSLLGDALGALANAMGKYHSGMVPNECIMHISPMVSHIAISSRQLAYFSKQYERTEEQEIFILLQGTDKKDKFILPKGRFYDEREWRFVPPLETEADKFWLINANTLHDKEELEKKNKILEVYALKFELNDIMVIVTETMEQREKLILTLCEKYDTAPGNLKTITFKLVKEL